jgi:hypothetical protein
MGTSECPPRDVRDLGLSRLAIAPRIVKERGGVTVMCDLATGDLLAIIAPGTPGYQRKNAVVLDAAAWSRVTTVS